MKSFTLISSLALLSLANAQVSNSTGGGAVGGSNSTTGGGAGSSNGTGGAGGVGGSNGTGGAGGSNGSGGAGGDSSSVSTAGANQFGASSVAFAGVVGAAAALLL
ncbi:putative secreted protein [Wickerhamomyces ciferrii]|uniref:Secreted protein n=1 Tax=Wickerhamomyces ciferrii (strain ATCC 14091 / BCRC 22168 / CBS 111 / JCM 3599 / NBRC 0793 / NRRL Y-1031 F-60-10) TaxID=1206466 RepID=K0KRM0_WICCF|nr:uncharacterized protein BN7_3537 [Wickerhamomyces ciferrii]CCH43983.1 putative secreted protein [Wickerhamomyces ciferrii]